MYADIIISSGFEFEKAKRTCDPPVAGSEKKGYALIGLGLTDEAYQAWEQGGHKDYIEN